jgi:hypothetical protein
MTTLTRLNTTGTSASAPRRIVYGFGDTAMGKVLIALGEGSITALMVGDDLDAMERDLLYRFPGAVMASKDKDFLLTVDSLKTFLENPETCLPQKLDLRGAKCRTRLWSALARFAPEDKSRYIHVGSGQAQEMVWQMLATDCGTEEPLRDAA